MFKTTASKMVGVRKKMILIFLHVLCEAHSSPIVQAEMGLKWFASGTGIPSNRAGVGVLTSKGLIFTEFFRRE